MDKQTIEKIEQLVIEKTVVEVSGRQYTPAKLTPVIFNPLVSEVEVHTLSGFCDFISHDIDGMIIDKVQLGHVVNHNRVEVLSSLRGDDRKRESLIVATIDKNMETFPFGEFMSQEKFAIRFRSMFEPHKGDDTEYVLAFASSLAGGTSIKTDDDGITQAVQVKRGISGTLKDEKASRPIVKLSPYRTFREIEQPQSEFLFRIRLNQNEQPEVALFEADGGKWIHDAILKIAAFITSRLPELRIIA
jgi:hypothetical protein